MRLLTQGTLRRLQWHSTEGKELGLKYDQTQPWIKKLFTGTDSVCIYYRFENFLFSLFFITNVLRDVLSFIRTLRQSLSSMTLTFLR